jgi:hypothetical protein
MKYRFVMEFEHNGPVERVPMDVDAITNLLTALRAATGIKTANENFVINAIRLEDA